MVHNVFLYLYNPVRKRSPREFGSKFYEQSHDVNCEFLFFNIPRNSGIARISAEEACALRKEKNLEGRKSVGVARE